MLICGYVIEFCVDLVVCCVVLFGYWMIVVFDLYMMNECVYLLVV